MLNRIVNDYFEWIFGMICEDRFSESISYRKLIMLLHSTEFTFRIRRDINRAKDGVDLRRRFALSQGFDDVPECLDGPCSVLEMMVALSIRCEETIMDDPNMGDRTSQWFWGMINNLGLGSMYDTRFDKDYVLSVIDIFLNRRYEPNGKGGLFTVNNADEDLRTVEIWYQLCWYLDNIT